MDVRSSADGLVAGRLLLADPELEFGIFRRAVIAMLAHDESGAQGVIVNRPIPASSVSSVLPGWQPLATGPGVIFQGGPVEADSALAIAGLPSIRSRTEGLYSLFDHVALVNLDEEPSEIAPQIAALRIFAGYAGWAPGQLEGELRDQRWIVVDANPGDLFSEQPELLWREVLRRQPSPLSWLSTRPEDASLN